MHLLLLSGTLALDIPVGPAATIVASPTVIGSGPITPANSPHCLVIRAGHDGLAVGADGHTPDTISVPLQHALLLAGQSVPHSVKGWFRSHESDD